MRNRILLLLGIVFLLFSQIQSVYSQTTEFTYQGNLNFSNAPGNGNFDLEFLLFDALSAGGLSWSHGRDQQRRRHQRRLFRQT